MKKYINHLLISLAIVFAASSCSLDEKLYDTLPVDALGTDKDLVDLLEGTYGEFNDPAAFKLWGGIMMMMLCADDFTSTNTGTAEFTNFGQKTYSSVDTHQFWDSMYRVIRQANIIESKINGLPEQTDLSYRILAEAQFLRGFAYYYLVRFFGGVPLRLDVVAYDSDFYLPRASVAEIYTQIFKDLEAAEKVLPLQSALTANENGRATKGAAQAILANASLTFGNYIDNEKLTVLTSSTYYQDAIDWCDAVILSGEYSLITKYEDLFDVEKQNNTGEIIFSIQFASDPNKSAQAAAGSEFALRFLPENMFNVTGNTGGTNGGKGGNTILVQPFFYYEYFGDADYSKGEGDMDYRLEKSFFTRWLNTNNGKQIFSFPLKRPTGVVAANRATKPQPYLAKYVDPNGKDSRNHGNDLIITRMSEIYMIKAEAINELHGPTAEALAAFNELRIRARKAGGETPRVLPVDLDASKVPDKDAFRLAVLKEKGLEFVGEGIRWFDLVRMPAPAASGKQTMFDYRFSELANETKFPRKIPTYNENNDRWNPNYGSIWVGLKNICEFQGERNKFRLFPIPKTEIDNNPNLTFQNQNPGW
ncbi:RagB/SusD family nutrient uptake outer membrane protein [Bacteroides sp. 51]|uniref:RagB/SusD family nutrient uptake outer membrane protein n=1 Tax=Bacteroides sp. 51 TaxID=2302938 RepID=UPI0013D84495|nr:RagB/SusD family nutrient uptake outer membrane protein [Bacteroides sp. 51]